MSKGRKFSLPSSSGDLMRQVQQLQLEMERAQAALAEQTVTVWVGGGAVTVEMTGMQVCRSVKLAPDVLASADADMLADMLVAAINQAVEASKALAAKRMGPLAEGLSLPPG
jgi:DNA-binding YbaB/EbfC family protein